MAKGCGRWHHIQTFYLLQKDHYQAGQKKRGDCRNGSYAKMTHKWLKQAYARGVAYVGKLAIIEDIALKHLQLKHLLNHPSHNHSNQPLQLKLLLNHPSHHHSNQPLQLKLQLSHPTHHHSNQPLQLKLQLSHPIHHHSNQPLHYHNQVHNLHNLYCSTKEFSSTFWPRITWAWKTNDEIKTECKEGTHMETLTTCAFHIIMFCSFGL